MASRRPPAGWLAPGASFLSGVSARLPGVDKRLAPPETRVEYLDGIELYAAPADERHATLHGDLAYVLRAHVKPPYRSAVDMLTRTDEASDFAPDASVFKPKPKGGRHLEELAFEVTDKQALAVPTRKARELARRGVRRIFALIVKHHRVLEWSAQTQQWKILNRNGSITDRCLVRPLPVGALLDATEGDKAVIQALLTKKNPALEEVLATQKAEGRTEGIAEGRTEGIAEGRTEGIAEGRRKGETEGRLQEARQAVLLALETRGFTVSASVRQKVMTCQHRELLQQWLRAAITAPTLKAVFA